MPFEVHESGACLHGTKADLAVGDLLVAGRSSNFGGGRTAGHVYFTATLDAATWGAELAAGEGRGRIYLVEPTGPFEDDPNVTDKGSPATPPAPIAARTRCASSARSRAGWGTRRSRCRPCATEWRTSLA